MTKCAIYCRYSSKNQDDSYSIEDQIKECLKYTEKKKWIVYKIFQDKAKTGLSTNKRESFKEGPVYPQSTLPWNTPWRIITIGEGLKTIVESTLGTDLAQPSKLENVSFIKPGQSSWSWVLLKDDSTIYSVQKQFIDFAADMNWEYCLVDADWDQKIGYDKYLPGDGLLIYHVDESAANNNNQWYPGYTNSGHIIQFLPIFWYGEICVNINTIYKFWGIQLPFMRPNVIIATCIFGSRT